MTMAAQSQIAESAVIRLQGISRVYQMGGETIHALANVDLDIMPNEYAAIMGQSGSGKSTLMNVLGCLDSPSAGDYWLNGRKVSAMGDRDLARARNLEIGFVFQTFNLLSRLTALSNVEVPLIYSGVKRRDRHARARDAARTCRACRSHAAPPVRNVRWTAAARRDCTRTGDQAKHTPGR